MLRGSYLAAGDRFTVRVGGVVMGIGKVAVQDAWSQGGLREEARDAQAEIGWTIDPRQAGQGYGTELARALLGFTFDDLGVRRVEAHAFADNAPSLRIMEKVGMRHEGTFKEESLHLTRGCQGPLSSAHRRPVFLPAGGHQNCPLVASWFARLGGGAGHRDGISSVA